MKQDTQTVPLLKTLPEQFRQFFWDIDATKLDPSEYPLYVINRLLDKGNLEAARWVLRQFPRKLIVETIKTSLNLSPMTAVFFSRYLNIAREEIRSLQPSYLILHRPSRRTRSRNSDPYHAPDGYSTVV